MNALEFDAVTKTFPPDKVIVSALSLEVKKGEFFSILGPSGCGKTTCLRLVNGLEAPTAGTIRINGKVVNNLHSHKRNVHTVFQKYALFPHLNVFENVAFGLRMKKKSSSEIRSRVEKMLQLVRLGDYAKRGIQQLSGGEQQRVALIRALVNEPDILLLDEPLAALDLKLREQLQLELASIQKQLGTTFIFVTHDQGEALTLSDRVAIMNKGKLEQIGTPTEVYEHPASTFVARFVGTTNLISGQVTAETENRLTVQTSLLGGETKLLYAQKPEKTVPSLSSPVWVAIRPEKIRIRLSAPAQTESPLNAVRGTLVERIYLGPTTQVKLSIREDLPPLILLISNQATTKVQNLKVGEKYFAVWEPSDCVFVNETPA